VIAANSPITTITAKPSGIKSTRDTETPVSARTRRPHPRQRVQRISGKTTQERINGREPDVRARAARPAA
jgi:hypothetical protein